VTALPPRTPRPHLTKAAFVRHVARNALVGLGLIVVSLGIGCVGYRIFAGLGWVDSLLNASMILTGMGPVNPMPTTGAKLFASFYAIFSGVAFLTIMSVVLAPAVHRFLHRFHLELGDRDADE
jgi:hypothetical protein